jgi:hypothetical protein
MVVQSVAREAAKLLEDSKKKNLNGFAIIHELRYGARVRPGGFPALSPTFATNAFI